MLQNFIDVCDNISVMSRKIVLTVLLAVLLGCNFNVFAETSTEFSGGVSMDSREKISSDGEARNLLFTSDADWKSYFTSSAEIIVMNLSVYNFCTLILDQSWKKPNPSIMWNNLTSPWLWDTSSFIKNQAAHPYFGNMYYTSARSNGLNFLQSLLMTAAGSFLWENCIEAGNNSLNDFLTTTFSGAIVGEVLYRLGNEAARIHPLLGALFNPVGGINSVLTGRKLGTENSSIHSLYFDLGFSADWEKISSVENTQVFEKNRFVPAAYFSAQVVYDNPYGHATKEFMDQFTAEVDGQISAGAYFVKALFDGEFYSVPLNIDENTESNFGASFDYDVFYWDSSFLSLNSVGAFFKSKINFGESFLAYGVQPAFVFFGVTENSYKKSDGFVSAGNATYTFGPEVKMFLEYNSPVVGQFDVNGRFDFLASYGNTPKGKKLEGNFIIISADASYRHKIYKNLYGGIKVDALKKIRVDGEYDECNRGIINSALFLEYRF